MPRIVETTVFHLDELSEQARETARAWYREAGAYEDWHNFVFSSPHRLVLTPSSA